MARRRAASDACLSSHECSSACRFISCSIHSCSSDEMGCVSCMARTVSIAALAAISRCLCASTSAASQRSCAAVSGEGRAAARGRRLPGVPRGDTILLSAMTLCAASEACRSSQQCSSSALLISASSHSSSSLEGCCTPAREAACVMCTAAAAAASFCTCASTSLASQRSCAGVKGDGSAAASGRIEMSAPCLSCCLRVALSTATRRAASEACRSSHACSSLASCISPSIHSCSSAVGISTDMSAAALAVSTAASARICSSTARSSHRCSASDKLVEQGDEGGMRARADVFEGS
mmetsp:Transcript_28897/g.88609  ORF Transcript_28897/g.88609 Transcript_28897/m.88609 type:complete len:294 (+) Transcript_28897:1198-2079(+)|eukprot:scaffold306443_cov26-Tisochrysis_lutea.AAC.3